MARLSAPDRGRANQERKQMPLYTFKADIRIVGVIDTDNRNGNDDAAKIAIAVADKYGVHHRKVHVDFVNMDLVDEDFR